MSMFGGDDLDAERASLRRIQTVHGEQLRRARWLAEKLAADAVEATEDGIRDVYDEDAEADAAVAAALVRQTSAQAMNAVRRVNELEAMGQALAFGYTRDGAGDRLNVGRLSVIDGEEALLVDWRADAAVPFYRATPMERLGVQQRRHLLYGDGITSNANQLQSYSDEVFDLAELQDTALKGEAALLSSVTAPTEAQMRSVVATIQAEQDAVIRAPSKGALVVQGGPGTGKTVVALHRAAYLLYDQRANLSDTGVLIVGPTTEFLNYIRGVLPSLGETGVVSVTAAKLFPGVLLGHQDPPGLAELKGRAVMAELLASAVANRQRQPTERLQLWYGSKRVVLKVEVLQAMFARAQGHRNHNEGARAFRDDVIGQLSAEVFDPLFNNLDDAIETFSKSRDVARFLLQHWPSLTPEQALNDLFGSRALLRLAASTSSITTAEADSMFRPRTSEADFDKLRWADADIPLLDELLDLLGGRGLNQIDERDLERDEADEFEMADQAEADAEEATDATADELVSAAEDADESSQEELLEQVSLDDPYFGERMYYESTHGASPAMSEPNVTGPDSTEPDSTDPDSTDPDSVKQESAGPT